MKTLLLTLAAMLSWTCAGLAADAKSVKVLIITGDHGHNWRETTPALKKILEKAGHKVDVTETPASDLVPDKLKEYDVLLFNYKDTKKGATDNPKSVWSEENKKAFAEAVHNGVGLVVYHHASSAFTAGSEWDKNFETLTAGGWRKQGNHGKMHVFTVEARK